MPRRTPAPRNLSLGRRLVFAALVLVVFLGAAELLLRRAERARLLDTHDRDDAVQFVEGPLFEERGGLWRTTRYAEQSLVPSSFAVEKGDRYRVFVLGASFAMGSPYRMQGRPAPKGGIADFVQAGLEASFPQRRFEVISVAAGGQDSSRVLAIARQVLRYEPDALVVATGNNEGAAAPSALRRFVQRQTGYRLLRGLLTGEPERTWFVPNDSESEEIRATFEGNITALLAAAREADVPVLLATLPIHLRFRGFDPDEVADRLRPGGEPDDEPLRERSCELGLRLFEAGALSPALPDLIRCEQADGVSPEVRALAASYRLLTQRFTGLPAQPIPPERRLWDDCIDEGIRLHAGGENEGALAWLGGCEDLGEALRWAGLSLAALDRTEEALAVLEQSVELAPRNRMRPDFNAFLRARPGVQLVDLDAAARARAPSGLPGDEQFLDSCHLDWRGYGAMAVAVLEGLGRVEPSLAGARLDAGTEAGTWGLPMGDNEAQVRWAVAGQR